MSDKSAIQWTDATWPVVAGCGRLSPGCDNCCSNCLHLWRPLAQEMPQPDLILIGPKP